MSQKVWIGVLFLAGTLCAQPHRVDPRNIYSRIICVVPFTGKGTPADPRRPLYAPWPPSQDPNGIIGFAFEPSDDGQFAIVEFVARSRSAFQAILNDKTITVFEKGKSARSDVEGAIKQHRKDFSMDAFGMVMP